MNSVNSSRYWHVWRSVATEDTSSQSQRPSLALEWSANAVTYLVLMVTSRSSNAGYLYTYTFCAVLLYWVTKMSLNYLVWWQVGRHFVPLDARCQHYVTNLLDGHPKLDMDHSRAFGLHWDVIILAEEMLRSLESRFKRNSNHTTCWGIWILFVPHYVRPLWPIKIYDNTTN